MRFDYQDYVAEIKKLLAWLLPTVLGVATKLAYESRLKKLTKAHVLTSLVLACFAGYISDKLCVKYELNDLRGCIVALAALASDTIVQYLILNSNKGVGAVIKKMTGLDTKNPEDKKEDKNDSNNN